MRKTSRLLAGISGLLAVCMFAGAQRAAAPGPASTIAGAMEMQLRAVEGQFVPAAEAMPQDKYSFAPADGNCAGE
jgi:hypothetical protein